MKPIEILLALPEWANATHKEILASPAWAMPCRLGDTQCTMRLDAVRPAETLNIRIRLENEEHILGIANSPAFPELGAVWASRADVPEPILLALVEKDCGQLLQLIENAVHRQLQIVGLAVDAPASDAQTLFAQVAVPEAPPIVFTLDLSDAISGALGLLRNIDLGHQSVREAKLPAEVEYATFALPAADLASMKTGDALLLPEADTLVPRLVVAGRFSLSGDGVAEWKDDGMMRVCAAEATAVDLGTLFDSTSGGGASATPPVPGENAPLRLVRLGKTVATGRFGSLAGQRAMFLD